jgi:hypothetical protein
VTPLTLDRVEIEDVGANPLRLAEAIHDQLGKDEGAIPVDAIARALDIVEIREEPLTNIEGALVTTPERGYGAILLNANSNQPRRRFTLAHELGHFLNPWHRATSPEGFRCTRADMLVREGDRADWYGRQEGEANTFAIELLAPRRRALRFLEGVAHIRGAMAMADAFDISREAAARHYVSLHQETLAVLFSSDGRFRYAEFSKTFPRLCLRKGDSMPALPSPLNVGISAAEEVDAEDWLLRIEGIELTAQTLHQQGGFAITILHVCRTADENGDELEDTFERFSRFAYTRKP